MPSDFVPKRRLLSEVSRGVQAAVTTTEAHGYETGFRVRLIVPKAYGMDLDYVETNITVTGETTFNTDLNTVSQLAFSAPSTPPAFTQAQVVPITGVYQNAAR